MEGSGKWGSGRFGLGLLPTCCPATARATSVDWLVSVRCPLIQSSERIHYTVQFNMTVRVSGRSLLNNNCKFSLLLLTTFLCWPLLTLVQLLNVTLRTTTTWALSSKRHFTASCTVIHFSQWLLHSFIGLLITTWWLCPAVCGVSSPEATETLSVPPPDRDPCSCPWPTQPTIHF